MSRLSPEQPTCSAARPLALWVITAAILAGCGPTPLNSQADETMESERANDGLPHPRVIQSDDKQAPPPVARKEQEPARRPPPEYALDPMSRKIPITGSAFCPPIELVDYSGTIIPFHKPLRIAEPFKDHVERFEQLAHDAAIEVYGRPPTRIRHFGSYYCRRISTWPYLVSEHGMGNAIDIGGFEFKRIKGDAYPDAPKRWRKSFSIRMSKHWHATGRDSDHSKFLKLLARRTIDQPGLFRVILGPAHPGHDDHLHLDMARARVINVF